MINFLKKPEKEPWQITAARYCVSNAEKGFTEKNLEDHIKSRYRVNDSQIKQFYQEEIYQPTGRQFPRTWSIVDGVNKWTPPLDLVSKITDYDELQEARKSSRNAMFIATASLVIAIIVGIIQICIAIYK